MQQEKLDKYGFPSNISRITKNTEPLNSKKKILHQKRFKTHKGGDLLMKFDTKDLEDSDEDREVLTSKDLPLEISEFVDIRKNKNKYKNTDYYYSYALNLQSEDKVVLNSSSARLRNLVKMLKQRFGNIQEIPAGKLSSEGHGFEKNFVYEIDED